MGAIVSLIVFTVIGIGLDLAFRHRVENHLYRDTQRVATDWTAEMRSGAIPDPPGTRADLVQLVDSRNRVVRASKAAAGMPALARSLPKPENRIEYITGRTPAGQPVAVTAIRIVPVQSNLLWNGEPHAVYAGRVMPPVLTTHRIELVMGLGVLLASVLATCACWRLTGRVLRPVREIREKFAEITVRDLSLRLPEPPGHDEIAELTRVSNATLERLDSAVRQQRHFASMVSHELRTPLTGLRTQLEEALLYRAETDPYETIKAAVRTTDRCQAIIDEMLSVARVRTAGAEPEPVDLGRLAREEAGACRTGRVAVRVQVRNDVTILGNRTQLCGLLTNLLVNAQRHAHNRVEVTVERAGDEAVVTVLDDGEGIAPEDRERVFEPFVRLRDGRRRDPKGTGLGLALCRITADAHHGSLRVEDSPAGARFVLRLPLAGEEENEAERPAA